MIHTPVDSSMIKHVDYDEDKQTLGVTFKNGRRYEYDGVSPEKHEMLISADSVGGHFLKNVKNYHPERRA